MRDFVREPERNQFGIEPEALRVRVGDTREVLEAHERHATAVDDQFTGVCRAHADHEHHIVGDVDVEQGADLLLRPTR